MIIHIKGYYIKSTHQLKKVHILRCYCQRHLIENDQISYILEKPTYIHYNYLTKLIKFICNGIRMKLTITTESRAAMYTISAQETTPGHAASNLDLISSITL